MKICDESRHEYMKYDVHDFAIFTTSCGAFVGNCVTCGNKIEFIGTRDMSFHLVTEAAEEYATRWKNRNPGVPANEQVVKNEYVKAFQAGGLGRVTRNPEGIPFGMFRMHFMKAVK